MSSNKKPPVHLVRDIPDKLLHDLGLHPVDVGQLPTDEYRDAPFSPVLLGLLLATAVSTVYLVVTLLAYAAAVMTYIPG